MPPRLDAKGGRANLLLNPCLRIRAAQPCYKGLPFDFRRLSIDWSNWQ
jgi:hypothetical protein